MISSHPEMLVVPRAATGYVRLTTLWEADFPGNLPPGHLESLSLLLADRTVIDGILCSRGYRKSVSGSHNQSPIDTYLVGTGELPEVREPGCLLANFSQLLFPNVFPGHINMF